MARNAALMCLMVLLTAPAISQLVRTAGVKGGIVAANQEWTYRYAGDLLVPEVRWGVDVGGYVEWLTHPFLSVSSEVHFIQKGFQTSVQVVSAANPAGTGMYLTEKARVEYLSLALLAKFRVELDGVTPYLLAGPRVDFKLNSESDGFAIVLDRFRSSEFGATCGIGAEVRLHPAISVGVEGRYSPTFQPGYESDLLKVTNRSFEILLVAGF